MTDFNAFNIPQLIMTHASRIFRLRLSCPNGCQAVRRRVSQYGQKYTYRFYSDAPRSTAGAVVIGAGPAGITVIGNLLEHDPDLDRRKLVWVDPDFRGGRVNARYREVPSNTKVSLFVQFAQEIPTFRAITLNWHKPNALTALQELPQDQGCRLSYAADLCLMLTNGLSMHQQVLPHRAKVTSAILDRWTKFWEVQFDDGSYVTTKKIVLCTGSSPISKMVPALAVAHNEHPQDLTPVDLDMALAPSRLAEHLDPEADTTMAVIGASHSAILVLMNLVELARSTHPRLRIKWFTRNDLRYAEYMDGWILRDNTGLKGQAADWARQNLDKETFSNSPVSRYITKIWTAGKEMEAYKAELPECTHIVQAVGYARDPLPNIRITLIEKNGTRPLHAEFNNLNGRFYLPGYPESPVPGLFGAGIAFPEQVTDPHGNVEYAVGFWKFMKFVKRVMPGWLESQRKPNP
ncbi:hypothetical protein F4777DRAFT_599738 [Nemania sp. FL0916]|nr:hypothetical protein F4777DRAFT_599738 [Nemania sp. FL0916]